MFLLGTITEQLNLQPRRTIAQTEVNGLGRCDPLGRVRVMVGCRSPRLTKDANGDRLWSVAGLPPFD
ncbi:hypothetical protein JJD41_01850 [Oxynema sp. CENA135]|uniref:hypothetical protein n=1 Tax=Oxynema sp. CENA135 TaxID=984206 RepID=UPI0019094541|nr:hypothetical protein [Oxynema sp. CENA135]MBK4728633.1 hypothetical protein [Oxynema sp. CENA135]